MIVVGRDLPGGFECSVDVCVIGSGSGGAVVAKELAESGLSVCVLEEGGYYAPEDYRSFTFAESARRMYRGAGATVALGLGDSPSVQIVTGRVVGGGSVLTGGVCFRTPDRVLDEWCREGLEDLSPAKMEPIFRHVERESSVTETPESLRSGSTKLFAAGAERLGIPMTPMRRNVEHCEGKGRCTTGCPTGAKKSVDVSYLKKARMHGAVVYSDCLVDRVLTRGRRAIGVTGRVLGGRRGEPRGAFTVHARAVVVAAGALHTPLVLRASGLGRRDSAIGRNLTLHPGFAVGAIAPSRVEGWKGALQTVYSDHLTSEGVLMLGMFADPSLIASRMPGVGARHLSYVDRVPSAALFAGLLRDEGRGVVRRGLGREPLVTYRMSPRDKAAFVRGFCTVAEMAFAGGAREVMLPLQGTAPIRDVDALRRIAEGPLSAARFESISFHPLCTARMGTSSSLDVVDPNGETYEVENLYVADGSVFRSSLGVNAQVPIMASATRIAWRLRDRFARIRREVA
jgi:choline dehydrogenase-like flavoprotein